MKLITNTLINSLPISYAEYVKWAEDAFKLKQQTILPPKISIKLEQNIFFNTMPCYLPFYKRIGVKMVSRYPKRIPSLISEILLWDSETGECLALMSGDWITAFRTGAVAALTIKKLQATNTGIYAFVGLGNTARSTLLCLLSIQPEIQHQVRILKYKDQADNFIKRFKSYTNVTFEIVNTKEELVEGADVIVSCVTAMDEIFAPINLYKEGVLVVPIHTRGFQNCDLHFDKIIGDDYEHIKEFEYFSRFKYFTEFSNVLNGNDPGRQNPKEKILAYNIGIALQDVYFASKIYDYLQHEKIKSISLDHPKEKFWI